MSYLHLHYETSTTNMPIDCVSVLHLVIWEMCHHKGHLDAWGQEEGVSVEVHTLHKGCQATGAVDRLFCSSIKPATPHTTDSNVFTFFLTQGIYLHSISFKLSLISTAKLPRSLHTLVAVSQSARLTAEHRKKTLCDLIFLVWNIRRSVNYVDESPILIYQDLNTCF